MSRSMANWFDIRYIIRYVLRDLLYIDLGKNVVANFSSVVAAC